MLSACKKCLFTQILKSLLPLATQEPWELLCRQQQPRSTWFLAQVDGVLWEPGGQVLLRHAQMAVGHTMAGGMQVVA